MNASDDAGKRLLSVVVPVYNEAGAIGTFLAGVIPVLAALPQTEFELIFVNDGSEDDTWKQLVRAAADNPRIRALNLSRNFGKEAALTAGIDHARGDAVVPMDVDLQEPPELIPRMVALWREGHDVVLARRSDRSSDSLLKRRAARLFYRLHNLIADVKLPPDVGDFRLMDRRVVEALKRLPERRRFMKGIFAWVGFRTASLDYVRTVRTEGASKFSAWKLWDLALEGFTSFSHAPLKIWTYVGLAVSLLAMSYGFYIVIRTVLYGIDVPGYASLLVAVLVMGGLQLMGLGIIGEYLGRIYAETKGRPIYIVRDEVGGRPAA